MHSKLSSEKWILDQSSIFAQVDAFVQRCKDLLEVLWCALYCQLQFVEQNWYELKVIDYCRKENKKLLELISTDSRIKEQKKKLWYSIDTN